MHAVRALSAVWVSWVGVVGESGDMLQAVYDALHALEEAHKEDDRMMVEMILPFWELTEVCSPACEFLCNSASTHIVRFKPRTTKCDRY